MGMVLDGGGWGGSVKQNAKIGEGQKVVSYSRVGS